MLQPAAWAAFALLFLLAGALNLWRALAGPAARRAARAWLAGACAAWAGVAGLLGRDEPAAAGWAAGLGALLMACAALASTRAAAR